MRLLTGMCKIEQQLGNPEHYTLGRPTNIYPGKLKVLHIANWYPTKQKPQEAPFIREHVKALNNFCSNDLVHIEVVDSSFKLGLKYNLKKNSDHHYLILFTPAIPWRLKEILSHWLLKFYLFRIDTKQYDIINIHIAYPLLTYIKSIMRTLDCPLAITEHWTAYQLNFNLPLDTPKLNRIKKIFHVYPNLITVSKSLGMNIRKFSGVDDLPFQVVPNAVNSKIFYYDPLVKPDNLTFFAVNNWRKIKTPLILLNAFKEFVQKNTNASLIIGGYGEMLPAMKAFVDENILNNNVSFVGYLNQHQIAKYLRRATAFVHSTQCETFSVVTAEALCCGTPVLVTKLPPIEEFVSERDGILIDDTKNIKSWLKGMEDISKNNDYFIRKEISEKAHEFCSSNQVGEKYFNALSNILHVQFN